MATGGTGRVDNFTVRGNGGDQAPYVADTIPANGASDVALNSSITINFSEPVNVTGSWFSLSCGSSGNHTATVSGGPTTFTLTPDVAFVSGEICALTVYAANVNDQDLIDPPDNMTVNFTAGFATVTPPLPIGTVNGPVLDTDDGTTHASPYVGQTVTVQGVIYEKTLQAISNSTNTYKGFFIQNTAATADTDPNTSDGLFVFMSTTSTMSGPGGAYTPTVGDEVVVSGKISEYYNMTELTSPTLVKPVVRSGVDIDAEVAPVRGQPARQPGGRQPLLGTPAGHARAGAGRTASCSAGATSSARRMPKSGWRARTARSPSAPIPTPDRAFRDAHPLDDNYDPTNWDGNGYRILMGSLGIKAAAGDAQALLDPGPHLRHRDQCAGRRRQLLVQQVPHRGHRPADFNEGPDPAANNPPQTFDRSIHYTIADYNLENLYDYRDNPFSGCDFTGNAGCPQVAPFLSAVTPPYDYVPASDAAYQARLNDIATADHQRPAQPGYPHGAGG